MKTGERQNGLKIVGAQTSPATVSRRELAKMFLAAAPALTFPAITSSNPLWRHLNDLALLDQADADLSSPNWKPIFLNAAQEHSLRALAEAIVPGSTKAHVSRFIDLLLSVESTVPQSKFLGSLTALDDEFSRAYHKPIGQLDAHQLATFLTAISSAPRSGGPDSNLRGHFEDLKEWIAGAYYSSEAGMRELGWTPDRVFASFPSCSHPEDHV